MYDFESACVEEPTVGRTVVAVGDACGMPHALSFAKNSGRDAYPVVVSCLDE